MGGCDLQAGQLIEVMIQSLPVVTVPRAQDDTPKAEPAQCGGRHAKIIGGFLFGQKARLHPDCCSLIRTILGLASHETRQRRSDPERIEAVAGRGGYTPGSGRKFTYPSGGLPVLFGPTRGSTRSCGVGL